MPAPEPPTSPDALTIEGRATWMLKNLHEGKRNRLAAAIGVSTAAVSRIFQGKQKIGPRMVAALAAHPRINSAWVTDGLGEPLRSTGPGQVGTPGRMLPVYPTLLTGSPEYLPRRSTVLFPVAEAHFSESRCWYQVPADAPITRDASWMIRPGDLLLLDYDGLDWLEDSWTLVGRLCVYYRGSGDGEVGVLGTVVEDGPDGRVLKIITYEYGEAGTSREGGWRRGPEGLNAEAVAAICIQLVRTEEGLRVRGSRVGSREALCRLLTTGSPSGPREAAAGDQQTATREKPAPVVPTSQPIIDAEEGPDETEPRQPAASATPSELPTGHQQVATPEEPVKVAPKRPRQRIVDT